MAVEVKAVNNDNQIAGMYGEQATGRQATNGKKAKKVKAKHMRHDEYKGSPMLVFQSDEMDRWPFSFGKGKAQKLVAAMEELGAEAVIDAIRQLANG